jgi:hypothetical protein
MVEGYPNNNSALFDDNGGADLDPVEEIYHFVIHHADATGGDGLADAPGLGCAMNAVFSVANIKGAGTQGVFWTTRHEGRNDMAPFCLPFNHDLRRAPIRPCGFARNCVLT